MPRIKMVEEADAQGALAEIYARSKAESVASVVPEILRTMSEHKVRRLPVINAKKRMVGMLSLGDVYNAASPPISEEAMQGVSAHHR